MPSSAAAAHGASLSCRSRGILRPYGRLPTLQGQWRTVSSYAAVLRPANFDATRLDHDRAMSGDLPDYNPARDSVYHISSTTQEAPHVYDSFLLRSLREDPQTPGGQIDDHVAQVER